MCNIFKLIGLLTVGYFILTHFVGGVLSKISLYPKGITVGPLSSGGFSISLPIEITNNSDTKIPIKGFDGHLLYNDTSIAPVFITNPFDILPNQAITVNVNSFIKLQDLASDMASIITSGQLLNNLRLVGDLFYEGISIPIDQVIKII